MFKLTFAFLLLVPGCLAQCTSPSCETDSSDTQMKVIMQQLEELRLENNKLKTTLEMTKEELRTTIGELETANDEFRTTMGGLETTNTELRKNISLIQTTSTELQTTNEQLQTTVDNLQMNVAQLRATPSASAAAYFSVAANTVENYNPGNTIKFPVTHTNVVPAGSTGGWDAATNMYTCPIKGDYMFVVTLWKGDDDDSYNHFRASLTRTSLSGAHTQIAYLYNYKHLSVSGDIRFSSTMQAIVPCRAGEKVSVRADCSSGCRLFDNNYHRNMFTGLKL